MANSSSIGVPQPSSWNMQATSNTFNQTVPLPSTHIYNQPTVSWPAATNTAPVRRRMSQWQKKWREVIDFNKGREQPMSNNYISIPVEALLESFGKLRPLYGGKPKREVMHLLMAANSEHWFNTQYLFKGAGLAYISFSIIGRKRMKARLTMGGLTLLDHWAAQFPKFKPFVDAYVSKTARKQIAAASFDFEMGVLPEVLQKQKEANDVIMKKHMEIEAQAAKIAQQRATYNNKRFSKPATVTITSSGGGGGGGGGGQVSDYYKQALAAYGGGLKSTF